MKKTSDLLETVIHKINNGEVEKFYKFFRTWDDIVGNDFSEYSKVKDLIKGSAIVEVKHSAGMNLMEMEKNKILKKLQTAYPELNIKKVSFVLSKGESKEKEIIFKKILKPEKIGVKDKNFEETLDRFNKLGD